VAARSSTTEPAPAFLVEDFKAQMAPNQKAERMEPVMPEIIRRGFTKACINLVHNAIAEHRKRPRQ
jgi:hypothetical protein